MASVGSEIRVARRLLIAGWGVASVLWLAAITDVWISLGRGLGAAMIAILTFGVGLAWACVALLAGVVAGVVTLARTPSARSVGNIVLLSAGALSALGLCAYLRFFFGI